MTDPTDPTRRDERSPLDPILDLFVYAPLGAAALAREALPGLVEQLIERGREELSRGQSVLGNQTDFVRSVGEALFNSVRRRAGGAGETSPTAPRRSHQGNGPAGDGEAAMQAIRKAQTEAGRAMQANAEHRREGGADDTHLPITDYEALSAAQVNARLAALSKEELAAVRDYEETNRGRRTILARIDALLE